MTGARTALATRSRAAPIRRRCGEHGVRWRSGLSSWRSATACGAGQCSSRSSWRSLMSDEIDELVDWQLSRGPDDVKRCQVVNGVYNGARCFQEPPCWRCPNWPGYGSSGERRVSFSGYYGGG